MNLPLFVEAALLALLGFAVGLFLAYLLTLHLRRGMNRYG
jgi:ABC-type lipoprotein release transport system permease subunit